jgi:hypothetical protein
VTKRSVAVACAALAILARGGGGVSRGERLLRVCADPDNMPFSNEGQGFENKLAELIARSLCGLNIRGLPRRAVTFPIRQARLRFMATRASFDYTQSHYYTPKCGFTARRFQSCRVESLTTGWAGRIGCRTPPSSVLAIHNAANAKRSRTMPAKAPRKLP